ncbi:Manganese transport system membrane protein MntB [Roseivivax sp. THAF40]|uniref:metal ABC transporter permease n=1 Tax=unclassified Roseivivax TaxID=2639302 RepID=UPI0012696B0F|nr:MULTISPECIES: metal ABC transporter permease [unclassified Roseivivax]QFS83535.1 Manganese transport system membrane protein MntB [Roseivivax sp. THAF197b]QFT47280.1 Manganese transport system membrane protein MntB [Roseivivax sp. THAF40]
MTLDALLLPFQLPFMQNAFLICLIVSVPAALLSCFLVTKGWALMGDAVSHAVLPGIVLAYILGIPLLIGAFAAGMTCAVATGYLAGNSRVKQDTVMGVVFSGMFGIGIVMYVSIETNAHLDHILFGNMLGIAPAELWTALVIAIVVAAGLLLRWRDLMLHAFDPAQAHAAGLPVTWLHYGLLAAISLTIVATLSAAGLILSIGLLIAPGAIAFLLVRTFRAMLWVSVAICMGAMSLGTYLSFFIDSAPAPTIVLILTALFVMAFLRRQITTRRASLRARDAVADMPG